MLHRALLLCRNVAPGICRRSSPMVRSVARRRLTADARGAPSPSDGEPRSAGRVFSLVREILFYSPSATLIGVALGGLGATTGGLIYFLHLQNVIDARNLYRGLDHIEVKIRRNNSTSPAPQEETFAADGLPAIPPEGQPMYNIPILNVPLPVLTFAAWTVGFVATTVFAVTRARLRLQFREFMQHCNFSLTSVENNVLKLRTLRESHLDTLLPDNRAAINIIMRAARHATEANPILALPRHEYDLIMTQVLNRISELFAPAYFLEDAGFPSVKKWYRFAITFRRDADKLGKSRKLRIVVVSEDLLSKVKSMPQPAFEADNHISRWQTLLCMANIYEQQLQAGSSTTGEMPCKHVNDLFRIQIPVPMPQMAAPAPNTPAQA